jgi:hypothetical protein
MAKPFLVPADDPASGSLAADLLKIGQQHLQRKPFAEPACKSADRRARKGRRGRP